MASENPLGRGKRAQCPTCFETFTTDSNFDKHLTKGRNEEDFDGPWCQPPASVGLVKGERGWHQPVPDNFKFGNEAA